ncbi:hypothetical protein B0H11DRAFT_1898737 [Mycena galericulata]|nr:hypothetical protein B0H11DRAFT_1898737 [Mycena galericulata]
MSLETDCQLPVRLLPAPFPYGASMGARSGWWSAGGPTWQAAAAAAIHKNFDDQDMSNKPSGLYIAHTSPTMDEGACLMDGAHAAGTYMGWRKELQHDARERRIKFRITKKLSRENVLREKELKLRTALGGLKTEHEEDLRSEYEEDLKTGLEEGLRLM